MMAVAVARVILATQDLHFKVPLYTAELLDQGFNTQALLLMLLFFSSETV